ncbi:MAG: DUF4139 domain-containing protein, partial [Myxococcales bacterium]|nr:DUF4139 domain-containing protein [Myxococcales bacterium]
RAPIWVNLAQYAADQQRGLRTRYRQLSAAAKTLEDEIRFARNRLAMESDQETRLLETCQRVVDIRLIIDKATDLTVEASYLVNGATWVPTYDVRVAPDGTTAEMVLKAQVAQRTGEDWPDIAMEFSTADLQRSTALPKLKGWRIGRSQPDLNHSWRPLPEGLDALFIDYDSGRARQTVQPRTVPATSLPSVPTLDVLPRELPDLAPPKPQMRAPAPTPMPVASSPAPAPPPPPSVQSTGAMPFLEAAASVQEEGYASASGKAAPGRSLARGAKRRSKADFAMRDEPLALHDSVDEMEEIDDLDESPEGPSELVASDRALGYGSLRMLGPEEAGRGQLKLPHVPDEVRRVAGQSVAERVAQRARGTAQTVNPRLPQYAVEVGVSSGHFAVTYPMDGRGSVPSDGSTHGMTVLRHESETTRLYRCVPSLDSAVYEMVTFRNPLGLPLLAGPVSVYRGADFLVTAPLPTVGANQPVAVNLGVEPGIVTARNVSYKENTEGLFGGDTVLEHTINIEVRSNLDRSARVEIYERIPVSDDKDAKVEVVATEPQAAPYDQTEMNHPLRGGLKFSLDIPAREKRTVRLTYRILIPSKQMLVGGNRRD